MDNKLCVATCPNCGKGVEAWCVQSGKHSSILNCTKCNTEFMVIHDEENEKPQKCSTMLVWGWNGFGFGCWANPMSDKLTIWTVALGPLSIHFGTTRK